MTKALIYAFFRSPIYPTASDKIEALRQTSTPKTNPATQRRLQIRSRVMACACRKPLPKCVICRQHFGSQAEVDFTSDALTQQESSATDSWFSWCCSCNHGGHLSHIRDWFKEYAVCPASGCDCRCIDRDRKMQDGFL